MIQTTKLNTKVSPNLALALRRSRIVVDPNEVIEIEVDTELLTDAQLNLIATSVDPEGSGRLHLLRGRGHPLWGSPPACLASDRGRDSRGLGPLSQWLLKIRADPIRPHALIRRSIDPLGGGPRLARPAAF